MDQKPLCSGLKPGDRVTCYGRPGTYYATSSSGDFHTIEMDDIWDEGNWMRPRSKFAFFRHDPEGCNAIRQMAGKEEK